MFRDSSYNGDISSWTIHDPSFMFVNAKQFDQKWCNPKWNGIFSEQDFKGSNGMHKCCSSGTYNVPSTKFPFIKCEDCPQGMFTDKLNINTTCSSCPAGWHQDEIGRQQCLSCDSGQYQDKKGEKLCKDCQIGQFVSIMGQTSCNDCGSSNKTFAHIGGCYQNEVGKTECKWCKPGKWSNVTGLTHEMDCMKCIIGRYSKSNGANTKETCSK